jgi:segregation and condensation protein B
LEAILMLAREPIPSRKLSEFANLADGTEARTLVRQLNRMLDEQGRAFRVEEVAGGYQLLSRPKFAAWLRRLGHVPAETRLSSPAMETLAVIAYRQPVLRADIEAIRGVNCGEILRQLMERDLARICGRSDELGRPYLYATTKKFLQLFGLPNIDKLPRVETMRNVSETDVSDPDVSASPDAPSSLEASPLDASPDDQLAASNADNPTPEKEESQVTDTMTVERNPELVTETTSGRRRRGNSMKPTDDQTGFIVQDLDDDALDEDEDDFEDDDDDEEDEDFFEDEDEDDDDVDDDDVDDDEDDDVGDDDEFEEEDDDEWEEVDDEDDEDWDEEDDEDDLDWEDEDEEEEEDEEEWD